MLYGEKGTIWTKHDLYMNQTLKETLPGVFQNLYMSQVVYQVERMFV